MTVEDDGYVNCTYIKEYPPLGTWRRPKVGDKTRMKRYYAEQLVKEGMLVIDNDVPKTYRVIVSEFVRHSDGSYESVPGTERDHGVGQSFSEAHAATLGLESSWQIAWVETLIDGVWYYANSDGVGTHPADVQDVVEAD
jgi:hypothetical protein